MNIQPEKSILGEKKLSEAVAQERREFDVSATWPKFGLLDPIRLAETENGMSEIVLPPHSDEMPSLSDRKSELAPTRARTSGFSVKLRPAAFPITS